MIDFFKKRQVAPYKWPDRLEVLTELPRRENKVNKQALLELLGRTSRSGSLKIERINDLPVLSERVGVFKRQPW
jgi:hypothetical protein